MISNSRIAEAAKWLKSHPLVFVFSIIVPTASITYAVVEFENSKIIALDEARIEQCKEVNQNVLQLEDQEKKIKKLDSIAQSWKYFAVVQNNKGDAGTLGYSPGTNDVSQRRKLGKQIKALILEVTTLLQADPTNASTFDAFLQWKSECNASLNNIDALLKTDYQKNFLLLTENNRADFQNLRSRIRDGTIILKTIYATIDNY